MESVFDVLADAVVIATLTILLNVYRVWKVFMSMLELVFAVLTDVQNVLKMESVVSAFRDIKSIMLLELVITFAYSPARLAQQPLAILAKLAT